MYDLAALAQRYIAAAHDGKKKRNVAMPRRVTARWALLFLFLAFKPANAGEVFKVAEGVFFECDIDASMTSVYSETLPSMYQSYKYIVQYTPTTWSDLRLFDACKLTGKLGTFSNVSA